MREWKPMSRRERAEIHHELHYIDIAWQTASADKRIFLSRRAARLNANLSRDTHEKAKSLVAQGNTALQHLTTGD